MLTKQIEQGDKELDYLESVLAALDEAENEADLAELREELMQTGILSNRQRSRKQKPARSIPYEYRTER